MWQSFKEPFVSKIKKTAVNLVIHIKYINNKVCEYHWVLV